MEGYKQLVAVCIPTANLGERSLEYLTACLESIEKQDYPRILIVISDHSEDNEIRDLIMNVWRLRRLPVIYHRNEHGRGNAVINTNQAIDLVPMGSLIKTLFQDDMLCGLNAISLMVARIHESPGAHWLGVGCNHIDEDGNDISYYHAPAWVNHPDMIHGLNPIGSPSVVMFQNCDLRMDPKLRYLNDCEFYYRMGRLYGPPALLHDDVVTVRMRKDGLSSTLDVDAVKNSESLYLRKKFEGVR
jgi:hypothetical protein